MANERDEKEAKKCLLLAIHANRRQITATQHEMVNAFSPLPKYLRLVVILQPMNGQCDRRRIDDGLSVYREIFCEMRLTLLIQSNNFRTLFLWLFVVVVPSFILCHSLCLHVFVSHWKIELRKWRRWQRGWRMGWIGWMEGVTVMLYWCVPFFGPNFIVYVPTAK